MLSIVNSRCDHGEKGFTLIETAISLVIIGLLAAPFFSMYSNFLENEKKISTDTFVQQSVVFLEEYRSANGAYPCPAKLTVPTNDASYGRAVDCASTSGTITHDPAVILPGTCSADGICMEQAVATRAGALTDVNVIVGALPFRDLQLEENASLDGYGSRLVYAVTYSMTDRTTFDLTLGAVSIVDENNTPRVMPEGAADYIVLSMGKTRQGGYGREGNLFSACIGVAKDLENCNVGFDTAVAVSSDSVYMSAIRSDATGVAFYDDVVEYSSQDTVSPWKRTDLDKENIETLAFDDVGIGTATPGEKLTISSSGAGDPTAMRVSGASGNDGKIFVSSVCDDSGNCFIPENLAGDNTANPATVLSVDPGDPLANIIAPGDGMKCPVGQYMVGITNGAAVCRSVIDVQCPDTSPVFRGLNANGTPRCTSIPDASCAAMTFAQCPGHATAQDVSLPLAGDGARTSRLMAGDCREQRYYCDNGTWRGPNWGWYWRRRVCTNTVAVVANPLCTSRTGYGPGPLTNYTTTGSTACSSSTSSTLLTDCTCIGVSQARNCAACPSGYSYTAARPTYTRERQCSGNNLNWWWTNTSSCPSTSTYCSCTTPAITTRYVNISCSDPTNMEADPTASIPDGTFGYKKQQVWNNTTCGWQDSGSTFGSCRCKLSNVTVPTTISCPACNETSQAGYNEYARHPVTCGRTGPPLASSVAAVCNPISYSWTKSGTYTGSASAIIPFDVNQACDCTIWPSSSSVNCKDAASVKHKCNCLP